MSISALQLLDKWRSLKRQFRFILGLTIIGTLAGYGLAKWSAPVPVYVSSARLLIADGRAGSFGAEWFMGTAVLEEVARRLSAIPPEEGDEIRRSGEYFKTLEAFRRRLMVARDGRDGTVTITAQDDSPAAAARLATTVAEAARDERVKDLTRRWAASRSVLEKQLLASEARVQAEEQELRHFREREGPVLFEEEARANLDSIVLLERDHEELLRAKVEAVRMGEEQRVKAMSAREGELLRQLARARERYARLPRAAAQLAGLERAVKVESEIYQSLKGKQADFLLRSAEQQAEPVEIEPAMPVEDPVNPLCLRWWLVGGGLGGLLIGLLAAWGRELLTTGIGMVESVQRLLGVPVLGVIPRYQERKLRKRADEELPPEVPEESVALFANLFTVSDPRSHLAEGMRSIHAAVELSSDQPVLRLLTITGAGPGSATTLLSVNLAVTFAQAGKRVLLVDADFRNPQVHVRMGIEENPGLADALAGSVQWPAAVRTVTDLMLGGIGVDQVLGAHRLDNLSILAAGSTTDGPIGPLQNPRLVPLLREMRDEYELVIVNTPPILPSVDAVKVSAKADGTILVFQPGAVHRQVLRRVKFLLDHARAKVLGVVLTDINPEVPTTA